MRAGEARLAAETTHGAQFVEERFSFCFRAGDARGVVVLFGFGDVIVEVGQSLAVLGQARSGRPFRSMRQSR
jgi:hypothetical protein